MASQALLDLLKHFEGLRLKAYPDPASGGEPWTIGYGHTGGVRSGDECSPLQAERWLADDAQIARTAVLRMVHMPMADFEIDALTSWVFNLGERRTQTSTLVRLLNSRERAPAERRAALTEAVANQLLLWTRGGGKVLPGLVARREAERRMFLGQDWRGGQP